MVSYSCGRWKYAELSTLRRESSGTLLYMIDIDRRNMPLKPIHLDRATSRQWRLVGGVCVFLGLWPTKYSKHTVLDIA